MLELELRSEAETLALGRSLAEVARGGDVIGLEGGLGAGKTTFARGAIHGLRLLTADGNVHLHARRIFPEAAHEHQGAVM